MELIADGVTPVPRPVLADAFETDGGHVFEPARPLFLFAGDRIAFEDRGLLVTRADGARVRPAGSWSTRCRVRWR